MITLKKIIQEALYQEEAENLIRFIEWIKSSEKEYYAVQNNGNSNYDDPFYAVGYIDKSLLYAKNPAYRNDKWEAIEPFYGENFEEATKILLDYWQEKYGIEIGKRYELPGELYGIEWYGTPSNGYRKMIAIYLENGTKIGSYYPAISFASYPDYEHGTGAMPKELKTDFKKAAWAMYVNYEKHHAQVK